MPLHNPYHCKHSLQVQSKSCLIQSLNSKSVVVQPLQPKFYPTEGSAPTYYLCNFSWKMHENEEILAREGARKLGICMGTLWSVGLLFTLASWKHFLMSGFCSFHLLKRNDIENLFRIYMWRSGCVEAIQLEQLMSHYIIAVSTVAKFDQCLQST